jgi:Lar family restriction alleviation protein
MNKTEQALPCPFCGGRSLREKTTLDERFGYADKVTYRCAGCGVSVSAAGDTSKGGYADNSAVEERALTAWNRRTLSQSEAPAGQPEDERERFEAWADEQGYSIDRETCAPRDYIGSGAADAWDAWQAAKRDALTQAPQERAAVTDKQIDDKVFCLGIQAYAYVDDPAGYRELVRSFISLAQSSEGKKP